MKLIRPQNAMLLSLLVLTNSCGLTLFQANVDFVGEQTALERQVLGTYADLGQDLTVYASVRAVEPDGSLAVPPEQTDSQQQALRAMANRRYNRDDLDTLLSAGVVGEGADGLLVYRNRDLISQTGLSVELVERVVLEENQDRKTIIDRLVNTTPGLETEQRPEVETVFASLSRDLAPSGSPIESADGTWSLKAE